MAWCGGRAGGGAGGGGVGAGGGGGEEEEQGRASEGARVPRSGHSEGEAELGVAVSHGP